MSRIDEALKVLERARYCAEHKCSECIYYDKCPDDYSEEEAQPCEDAKQRLCKDCRYFESDHWEKVDGIPLIVAHEICNRWGDGCKTSEDGYCFLFEPKMEGE